MKVLEYAFTVYPVTDLAKARRFYEGTLGLRPEMIYEEGGYGWVEYEIGTGVLAIGMGAPGFEPSKHGGSIALEMEDYEAAIAELKAAGGTFYMESTETPVCHMAAIADPDGNTIIIHKRKTPSQAD